MHSPQNVKQSVWTPARPNSDWVAGHLQHQLLPSIISQGHVLEHCEVEYEVDSRACRNVILVLMYLTLNGLYSLPIKKLVKIRQIW